MDLWVYSSRQQRQEKGGRLRKRAGREEWVTIGCHPLTPEAYAATMASAIKDRFAKSENTAGEAITSPSQEKQINEPADSKTD